MATAAYDPPVARALLGLIDASVRGEDEERLLDRLAGGAAGLPRVEAASCSLLPVDGRPLRMGASDDNAGQLERVQAELLEGPCVDSARTGKPLTNLSMVHAHSRARWPHFAPRVLRAGFTAVTALPIRHDGVTGSLNLYHQHGCLHPEHLERAGLLTTATAIGLAHLNALHEARVREQRLQGALDSRILVEQAKGILAERFDCTVDEAFERLRHYARTNRLKLLAVARETVDGPPTSGPFHRPPR